MASLRAQRIRRSVRPSSTLNKAFSFFTFLILLTVGWVAVSYLKSEIARRGTKEPSAVQLERSSSSAGAIPARTEKAASAQPLAPSALVYCADGEGTLYHASSHRSSQHDRSALSEHTARRRGLRPCPVCIRR